MLGDDTFIFDDEDDDDDTAAAAQDAILTEIGITTTTTTGVTTHPTTRFQPLSNHPPAWHDEEDSDDNTPLALRKGQKRSTQHGTDFPVGGKRRRTESSENSAPSPRYGRRRTPNAYYTRLDSH
jgi:hypothetical protein